MIKSMWSRNRLPLLVFVTISVLSVSALSSNSKNNNYNSNNKATIRNGKTDRVQSRRAALGWLSTAVSSMAFPFVSIAATAVTEEGTDIRAPGVDMDRFIKTGKVSQPMGVSGQAGKSRPETGVILREGSQVSRNTQTGEVVAEIIVKGTGAEPLMAVLASYESPWPLAKGTVFDVECRDSSTGDAAFLQVSRNVKGSNLSTLNDSFFLNELLSPTGRFSFYGPPTDVKVLSSSIIKDSYRVLDISFSTISQATQTEIPRKARVIATLPQGSSQAVMLVSSASALRWKKGSSSTIATVIDSFRAIPAPPSGLKLRGKERGRGGEI